MSSLHDIFFYKYVYSKKYMLEFFLSAVVLFFGKYSTDNGIVIKMKLA